LSKVWIEKDYVTGGWYIWFGKKGPKYLPDGTKWLSRGVPGQSTGYSLNPMMWIGWLGYFISRPLMVLLWALLAAFLLGTLIGK
jgi:hypothetical protein